jgi:hypothetical protein
MLEVPRLSSAVDVLPVIAGADLMGLFEKAMDAFDRLDDQYGAMDAAA